MENQIEHNRPNNYRVAVMRGNACIGQRMHKEQAFESQVDVDMKAINAFSACFLERYENAKQTMAWKQTEAWKKTEAWKQTVALKQTACGIETN